MLNSDNENADGSTGIDHNLSSLRPSHCSTIYRALKKVMTAKIYPFIVKEEYIIAESMLKHKKEGYLLRTHIYTIHTYISIKTHETDKDN